MPRQARLDIPGTLHHVMIRGIERKPIVRDHVDRKEFIDRMGRLALESKSAIYAWALMTNHAHILLRSGPKKTNWGTLFTRLTKKAMGSRPDSGQVNK